MTHHILAGTKGQHPSLPFHWRKTGQMPQLLKSPWHGNCLGRRGGCCCVCVSLSEPQQIHLYLIKKVPGTCLNICPLYPVLSSGHHSTTAQHISLFHPQRRLNTWRKTWQTNPSLLLYSYSMQAAALLHRGKWPGKWLKQLAHKQDRCPKSPQDEPPSFSRDTGFEQSHWKGGTHTGLLKAS